MGKQMCGNQKGFTLIELIIVIVLLGLLAAVAIPKYVDMKTDAQKAAANGVLGGAAGATAINFAGNILGKNLPLITTGATLVGAMDGGLPTGWATGASGAACLAAKGVGTSATSVGCIYLDVDGTVGLSATDYIVNIDSVETATAKAVVSKFGASY